MINQTTCSYIEEFIENINNIDQIASQLSQGVYSATFSHLKLPNIDVVRSKTSQKVLYQGVIDKEFYYVSIPDPNCNIKVNGYQMKFDNLYISAPGEELTAVCEPGFSGYHLTINSNLLKRAIGEEHFGTIIPKIPSIREITFPETIGFVESIVFMLNNAFYFNGNLSPVSLLDLEDNIYQQFIFLFNDKTHELANIRPSYNKRLAIVRRAADYILSTKNYYISIDDLSSKSFCSRRTLEYSFMEILGISPKRYTQLLRIHNIRYDLFSDSNSHVNEILRRHGVVNNGRFSQLYKRFFHEYPKETKRK